MAFFKQFPQIDYDIQENGEISKIYDMYRHVDVVNKKTDDFTSYTFYEIKDGDRPDIISQKLYGTPDYYWTFFIINDFLQHGYNYFYKSYQTFMRGLQLEYEGKGALVVLPNYTNSFNVLGGIDITNDIINVIRKKTVNDYELVNMILRDDRPSINTVEVRRNVDGTEKVFTIDEVTDGTLEGFVNASFNDELPLDQATGAAAAYSLRKLKEDFTGDVVEVRRNVDGETEGFTADEVTDGTLESFVNASVDDELPLDQATGAAAAYSLRSLGSNQWTYGGDTLEYESDFSVSGQYSGFSPTFESTLTTDEEIGGEVDCLKVTASGSSLFTAVHGTMFTVGEEYFVSADVYIPSSNNTINGVQLSVDNTGFKTNENPTLDTWFTISGSAIAHHPFFKLRGLADGNAGGHSSNTTDVFYVRNVKVYENIGDTEYLPSGKYVVQVRRSSDDAVQSFTASEVADGTLEDWVNAEYLYPARGISETSQTYFSITKTDNRNFRIVSDLANDGLSDTKFIQLLAPQDGLVLGKQRLTFDVDVNSGNISNFMLRLSYRDAQTNLQPVAGSNSFEFVITDDGASPDPAIYFAIHGASSFDVSISNLQVHKIENDGHVKTWYDQSGNTNHATQTDAAKQPKIVDAGVLVTRNGDAAIKSTSNNKMAFTLDSLSADGQQSVFAVLENDVTSQDGFGEVFKVNSNSTGTGGVNRRPYWFVNPTGGLAFTVDSASGYQNTDREYRLYSHTMNDDAGGTSTIHRDGTQVDTRSITLDANATFSEGKVLGVTTNATGALYMSEVIYYDSDQSDKRRAIEENIANHYDITLAAFSRDGTVSTWYDQSGNTNDATQTDPTNQPKIVENGSVLEDSAGNPEIDFDGTSHRFDIDFGSNLPQPNSIFMVHQSDSVLEADNEFFDEKDTTGQRTLLDVSTVGAENRYRMRAKTSLSSTNIQVTTDKNLVSAIYNGSNSSMSLNGDSFNFTNTVGSDSIARLSSIGFSEGTGNYYDGTMQEFIIYNSDQSTKRRAIEENIANHYDITLAAFSRDGTVKTWTYQIGTNDDPSSQPKIVVDGSLLTNNTQLSSLNEVEVMTVSDPISWNPHNLQLIVDNVTDESIFFDDSSIDRYSLAFKDSATSEQKVEWLKEFNEAQRELKGPTYINLNENTLSSFEFTAERRYEELITAPYSYYATIDVADRVSVGDTINAYDAARSGYGDLDQFTTYYQHEEDENELSRKLKVVRPQEIEQFTEQYKTLINS